MGYIPIPWLRLILLPLPVVRNNLYYILVSNSLECILPVALAPLIEIHCHTYILLLFIIGFNPYTFYFLFYDTPKYVDISICPYLFNRIWAYVWLLIFIRFFLPTDILCYIIYVCGLLFLFSSWLFLSIAFCLCSLIASQSATNGVFNIMPPPKIIWPVVSCILLWCMIFIARSVFANIPDQG